MIAKEFPSLTLVRTKKGAAGIVGTIAVNIGKRHEIIREARVAVYLENDYPNSEPVGRIAKGTFAAYPGKQFADRHMGEDGWCCLELPAESSWDPKDSDALRKWLTNFIFFVHRQFIYDINDGVWPGPEWKHGARGWAQFVLEKAGAPLIGAFAQLLRDNPYRRDNPCPCGSTKHFAQCHKRLLDDVLTQLPNDAKLHRRIADVLEESEAKSGDDDLEEAV